MTHQQARGVREPRTKILESGAAALSEVELLAIIFQRGAQAGSSMRFCDQLLSRFGGIRPLFSANSIDLCAALGVGTARLAILRALPEIATRFFEATLPIGESIRSPADTEMFLRAKLRDLPHELFCCVYLDNRHRVLRFAEMFRGTIDGTSVYPREVVKEALAINAAAVILAHNHPSGVTEPSQADERITRRLKAALELVDIRLLDHLIIGDGDSTSLASRGLL